MSKKPILIMIILRSASSLLLMLTMVSSLVRFHPFSRKNRPCCSSRPLRPPLHFSARDEYGSERQIREAILEKLFLSHSSPAPGSDNPHSLFLSLSFLGESKLPLAANIRSYTEEKNKKGDDRKNSFASVLVVGDNCFESRNNLEGENNEPLPVLFLPLSPPADSRLRLLSKAYKATPIPSFSNMIQYNLNLINRDNSLFDNIPWNQWSKDPHFKNRDSAGNLVNQKFRYGKRDAYNRFMGKDVNSKTVIASKRKYWQNLLLASLKKTDDGESDTSSKEDFAESDNGNTNDFESSFSQSFLSKRVLELRIQELRMEIAGVDSQLAISRMGNSENQDDLEKSKLKMIETLREAEKNLNELLSTMNPPISSPNSTAKSRGLNVIDQIVQLATSISMNTRTEKREAPYRGATGYAPRLGNDDSDVEFYRSPFDLLNEILGDQLNAEVIECVLENTSWLGGTIVLGGAVVLRRKTPQIERTLMGESFWTPDKDEDFGNFVKGGEIFIVECDVDEVIGVALSCDLPIRIERSIFERSAVMGARVDSMKDNKSADSYSGEATSISKNTEKSLPYWRASDSRIALDIEGQMNNPNVSRLSPISIPLTTSSLFDSLFETKSDDGRGDGNSTLSMFPSDNPIKTIDQWDSLDDRGKAKTLLEISNFSGKLPRPRTVRNAPANENPLDKLLLPLIDESVRNEYYIRDAMRRGDLALVNELKAKKSDRLKAKEQVDEARRNGDEDMAKEWETESAFLEGLRADVTQDEGSYSRFLDKDDWYERDRQRTAKRAKRSSFGTLLDGIE